MSKDILHTCSYCQKPFKTEAWFLKHKCKAMIREEEFASIAGQAGWIYYKMWLKHKHHSSVRDPNAFKHSKYFGAFYKFITFIKQTNLPDIEMYIKLMVKIKIDPIYWTAPEAYGKYLEYFNRQVPIQHQVQISINTLFEAAENAAVDIGNVFDVLSPNAVIQLLNQRKLSPWLLLLSHKFIKFHANHTSTEERIILEGIINPEYWAPKIKKHPTDVNTIKMYISELNL